MSLKTERVTSTSDKNADKIALKGYCNWRLSSATPGYPPAVGIPKLHKIRPLLFSSLK